MFKFRGKWVGGWGKKNLSPELKYPAGGERNENIVLKYCKLMDNFDFLIRNNPFLLIIMSKNQTNVLLHYIQMQVLWLK